MFVLFDPPASPGASLPRGGPRRAARSLRSAAISHSTWSAPRPARRAGIPAAPQPQKRVQTGRWRQLQIYYQSPSCLQGTNLAPVTAW